MFHFIILPSYNTPGVRTSSINVSMTTLHAIYIPFIFIPFMNQVEHKTHATKRT